MSSHLAFPARPCVLLLAAALLGSTIGAGVAFGRDAIVPNGSEAMTIQS